MGEKKIAPQKIRTSFFLQIWNKNGNGYYRTVLRNKIHYNMYIVYRSCIPFVVHNHLLS